MSDTENTRLREEVAQLTKEVERVWEVGKALVAFEREVNARLAKERDEARSRFEEAFRRRAGLGEPAEGA